MYLERLTSADDCRFGAAAALYAAAFPLHEQRLTPSQRAIMADPDYHYDLVYDEGRFAGILLHWRAEAFCYIEHFAVCPDLRGRGCGARALGLLAETVDVPIVLEIDPPTDEISVRRQHFYTRCGYAANPYPHHHPPYRVGYDAHPLLVMSRPGPLTPAGYAAFAEYLKTRVMGR